METGCERHPRRHYGEGEQQTDGEELRCQSGHPSLHVPGCHETCRVLQKIHPSAINFSYATAEWCSQRVVVEVPFGIP